MKLKGKALAYWIADKIPAYGDYAKEAADILRDQANKIEQLEQELDCAKDFIAQYRIELKQSEEDLEIGRQIRRAAGDLPDRYDIKIHVEKGFAGVTLIDDRNKPRDFDFEENLSDAISEAIDAAIKESK